MMNIIKNNKGFSLLEVLVTATIITIGLLAILGMQITSIKGNSFGYQMTAATTEAENIMEQIFRLPLSDTCLNDTSGDEYRGDPISIGLCPDINTSGDSFLTNIKYIVEDQNPQSGSKTITIILDWTDNNGITRNIQMKTVKSM